MAMDRLDAFASLMVVHGCGHSEEHAVPQKLNEDARQRVTATLSEQRCWRCVTDEAWEQLPPWTPTPPERRRRPQDRPSNGGA